MQRERCHNWQGLEPVGSRNSKFWHSTPAIETRTTVVVSIDDVLRGDLELARGNLAWNASRLALCAR